MDVVTKSLIDYGSIGAILILAIIWLWQMNKRFNYFFEKLFYDLQKRLNQVEVELKNIQEEYQAYLKTDNKEIKSALEKNMQVQKETTATLDNAIEIIKLNTQAYEKSIIAYEKYNTYITQITNLIQQWMQK